MEHYDYYYSQDVYKANKPKRIRGMRRVEIRQIREIDTQSWGEILKGLWKTGRLRRITLRWNCRIGCGVWLNQYGE